MVMNPEFVRILCLSFSPQVEELGVPELLRELVEWAWSQYALIRWSSCRPNTIDRDVLMGKACVVFDWRLPDINFQFVSTEKQYSPSDLKNMLEQVRHMNPELPIIVYRDANDTSDGMLDNILPQAGIKGWSRLTGLDSQSIQTAFTELGLELPSTPIQLNYQENDPFLAGLIDEVGGKDALKLTIQKFFPEVYQAYMDPVNAGWSGTKLCNLLVDGQAPPYFLKFFRNESEYVREVDNHQLAVQNWLGNIVVPLKHIDAMGQNGQSQLAAFSVKQRPAACYESARTSNNPRVMLRDLYTQDVSKTAKAIERCLEILNIGQNSHVQDRTEQLWHEEKFDANSQDLNSKRNRQARILATADDLSLYGPAVLQIINKRIWEDRILDIVAFIRGTLPAWLLEKLPVQIGHVHGDPNPRNWLVDQSDPTDVRVIDCGDYTSNGRLVSDLAIMERDIKFVLLGTEKNATAFRDLDTSQVPQWAEAEANSIKAGINYSQADAGRGPATTIQAYKLVARVRRKAKRLCCAKDPEGRHYFAALLYWTLDMFRYETIRRTKRLLALLSASEILKRF